MAEHDAGREGEEHATFPGFASFRDEEGAPFYRSLVPSFRGPDGTAAEITRHFSGVVFDVMRDATRRPLRLEPDHLLRWHRRTFRTTFPYQAGEIRRGPTEFGIRWREDGELHKTFVKGSHPNAIREELRAAFGAYNAERDARSPERRSTREAISAAATLYADLLRIHPFEDGNLRAAFPALQGALISLGAAPVDFKEAVAEHDEALGWALRAEITRRTLAPFTDLLISKVSDAQHR